MSHHGSDKQNRHDRVNDLGKLHSFNSGKVEREHQLITGDGNSPATDDDDPIDRFLTCIKTVGWWMVVTDDSATPLEPIDIDLVWNIAGDPHQEDQHNADGEGETQIVVRIFRPLRPFGECVETNQRQQQWTAEGDVQSRDGQNNEAARGHPVHEALERGEAHDGAAGPAALKPDHATGKIEDHHHGDRAEDGDPADPA